MILENRIIIGIICIGVGITLTVLGKISMRNLQDKYTDFSDDIYNSYILLLIGSLLTGFFFTLLLLFLLYSDILDTSNLFIFSIFLVGSISTLVAGYLKYKKITDSIDESNDNFKNNLTYNIVGPIFLGIFASIFIVSVFLQEKADKLKYELYYIIKN